MEQANGFQAYLNTIKKVPLLSAEQEKELILEYTAGNIKAKNKLVEANLRLVIMAVKQYNSHTSIPFEDLVQEGNLGLIRAVDTFDISKGFRFSTYAMHWIKQSISRAILNNGRIIRIPIHMLERKSKYNKAVKDLYDILNRNPVIEEIATYMELSVEEVKEIENLIKDPVSINTVLNDDEEDGTLEDLIADPNQDRPDDRMDNEFRAKAIEGILNTLDNREKSIIIARFGLNGTRVKTLDELASEYSLTKERIRQIEQNALHKMRHPIRLDALRPYATI